MVHATQNCMGIAWERDNVYWTLNGEEGTLDRYDFGVPHVPGGIEVVRQPSPCSTNYSRSVSSTRFDA